jgi:hypothetical protein
MAMSAEKRAEASERMKGLHASGKMGRGKKADAPLQLHAMGITHDPLIEPWEITIAVDWEHLRLEEAQQAYAQLRKQFEKAGFILNARSMPAPGQYVCFICQKTHLGDPRGKDYSYKNPSTGLMEPVSICGERDWLAYQDFRIRIRALIDRASNGSISDEHYIKEHNTILNDIRKKYKAIS